MSVKFFDVYVCLVAYINDHITFVSNTKQIIGGHERSFFFSSTIHDYFYLYVRVS